MNIEQKAEKVYPVIMVSAPNSKSEYFPYDVNESDRKVWINGYIAGATEAQDDWTRVEDGLPEEDKAVQVYVPNLYWLNHIAQGYVINNQWKIKYDNLEEAGDYPTEYVTHWRNLPSPPSNDKP